MSISSVSQINSSKQLNSGLGKIARVPVRGGDLHRKIRRALDGVSSPAACRNLRPWLAGHDPEH